MRQSEEKRKQRYRKAIVSMTLLDDEFFTQCLQDNPEAALLIIRVILRKPDLVFVDKPVTQKTIRSIGHKTIRLDLYAQSEGRYIDVEIQRVDRGAAAPRARFYSSVLDTEQSFVGEDYSQLADTYVIFITENDLLRGGLPYYTIERTIREMENREFGDGSHIIYVNGAYEGADDIGRLMHDFRCVNPHEIYNKELRDAAVFLKETEKGVEQMSKAMEELWNDSAREATEKANEATALRMIRAGKLTDEDIASYSGLDISRVKELHEEEEKLVTA